MNYLPYFYRLTIACLLLSGIHFSHAALPGGGNDNFKPEDHLLKQAKKDDKKAQLELALCYLVGKYAVEPDAEEALDWLTKAASQDKRSIAKGLPPHPRALLYLGFCHENPMYADFLEIKIDRKKALHYYLLAESKGYEEAAQYIAKTYRALGEHVKAISYFKKAADMDIPSCQVEYGKLLLTGDGVKQDVKAAMTYFKEAGKKGNGEAFLLLADIYSGKYDTVPQDLDAMIDALWQSATTRSDAMTRIGYCYQHGIGLPKDPLLAYKWYSKAATDATPDVNARIALAQCYSQGIGVEVDPVKAFENYLIASSSPDAPPAAHFNVGMCYLEGKGVKGDTNQAFIFFQKAVNDTFAPAYVMLGKLYEEGKAYDTNDAPLPPSPEQAFAMYKKAADLNHMAGQIQIGRCYYLGKGTAQDKEKGLTILRNAARLGSKQAVQLLIEFKEPLDPGTPTPEKTPQSPPPSNSTNDVSQPTEAPDKPLMQF